MGSVYKVSHTKLSLFRRCLQSFEWKYGQKLFPPSGIGQLRGSAGHSALAEWHVSYDEVKALDAAWQTWSNGGQPDNAEWQLLETSLNRYFQFSRGNDTFTVLEAEREFFLAYPVTVQGDEWHVELTGFIDAVIEEPNGRRSLLENKFYKRMDNSSKEMDMQVAIYLLASRELGYNIDGGVLYNMVRVADSKVAITEPVVRQRVYRNSLGLDRVLGEVLAQSKAMIQFEHYSEKEVFRNPTKDCSWDCPFHQPCLSMTDDGMEPKELLLKACNIRSSDNDETS